MCASAKMRARKIHADKIERVAMLRPTGKVYTLRDSLHFVNRRPAAANPNFDTVTTDARYV